MVTGFHFSHTSTQTYVFARWKCALRTVRFDAAFQRNETKWNKKQLARIKIEWTRLPAITVSLKLYLAAVFGKSFNLRPLSLSSPLRFASSNTFGIKPAIVLLFFVVCYFGLSLLLVVLVVVMTVLLGVVALFTLQRFFEHLTKNVERKEITFRNERSKYDGYISYFLLLWLFLWFFLFFFFCFFFLATLVELDFHNIFYEICLHSRYNVIRLLNARLAVCVWCITHE